MAANAAHPHFERTPHSLDTHTHTQDGLRFLVPVGRLLFSAIFIASSVGHFSSGEIHQAAQHGVPMASLLVPISGLIALFGGLSVLFGFKARFGAWLLILFLIPVTLAMHAFWAASDPATKMMQQIMFMKNVTMIGGALLIAYFGAGPVSFDERRQ
ncbi:MAG TPA: DoxX family protein [Polyangiaceae bacterium]|jgi:putative oxidoreductase